MYAAVLAVHSWVRWALVLIAALACLRSAHALVRSRSYSVLDERVATWLMWLLNLQLFLGLALYVLLSPLVRTALTDLGAAMASAPLRFFAIEHQVAALLAIGIGHLGLARARKTSEDRGRHLWVFWGAAGCLMMILIAIPWPFLPYGRALFRI